MTRSIFDTNGFPYNVKIPFSFMTNRTSRLIRVGVLFAKIRLSWKISQKNNTEEGKGEKKGAIYPKEKNGVGLDFSVCLDDRLASVSYLLSLLEIGLRLRIDISRNRGENGTRLPKNDHRDNRH